MPNFTIYPAIDLRQGGVVRLKEGDPDRMTLFSHDPAQTARNWLDAGAAWLHVVNLDGAFGQPDSANYQALQAILAVAQEYQAQVQFGGALRSIPAIQTAFNLGIQRAILGTAAILQPEVLEQALIRWGKERIVVSLDSRHGKIFLHGWQTNSETDILEGSLQLKELGLEWLIFTDITRDGMQTGLNLPAAVELASTTGLQVIASGGVSGWQDIHNAHQAGLAGVVVGRALYEGKLIPIDLFHYKGN